MSEKYTTLNISDIHMSNKLPHAKVGEDGITNRLRDQMKLWRHVIKSVEKYKVDAVFIQGDLFDKSLLDPITLTHTVEAIVAIPTNVWVLGGNHGASSVTGGRYMVEAFGAMRKDNIHFFKTGQAFSPRDWLNFYPVSFCPTGEAEKRISEYQLKLPGETKVLLLHHSIVGCSHIGWTCDDGLDAAKVCEGFDQVISGHFHEHQQFGPKLNGMYLGAPMHHHFGDIGRPAGYWIMRYQEGLGCVKTKMIDPKLPKFHSLDYVDGDWRGPEKVERGDFVRIQAEVTAGKWIKLKPRVMEMKAELEKQDVHVKIHHKPVHVSEVRIRPKSGGKTVTMEDQVRAYAKHSASSTEGGVKKITKLGLEILEDARNAS